MAEVPEVPQVPVPVPVPQPAGYSPPALRSRPASSLAGSAGSVFTSATTSVKFTPGVFANRVQDDGRRPRPGTEQSAGSDCTTTIGCQGGGQAGDGRREIIVGAGIRTDDVLNGVAKIGVVIRRKCLADLAYQARRNHLLGAIR